MLKISKLLIYQLLNTLTIHTPLVLSKAHNFSASPGL